MKLNKQFQILPLGEEYCAACPDFQGVIHLTESGAHIFSLLADDTTEAAILDSLCARYEAPRDVLAADLQAIINQCRTAGLLEE